MPLAKNLTKLLPSESDITQLTAVRLGVSSNAIRPLLFSKNDLIISSTFNLKSCRR